MLVLATLSFLAGPAYSLAIPQDGGGVYPLTPNNTTVYYYTGSMSSDICNMNVGSGFMQQGVCNTLTLSGYGIQQAAKNNCTFTLWSGSAHCDVDATEKTVYQVPAGKGVTCVGSGVLDGGKWEHASGVWSCA